MKKYKPYLTRVDLVKNQVERERIQEQEAKRKRKQRIQEQNRQNHLRYQEQLRSEMAARYFHSVISAGGESFSNTKSLNFDGSNDFVSLASISLSSEFTISVWIKPTNIGSTTSAIINSGTNNSNRIGIYDADSLQFKLGGSNVYLNETGGNNFLENVWQHVLVVRDSSNNMTAFRNGASFGTSVTNSNTGTFDSLFKFKTTSYSSGGLDEIAIWNSDQSANVSSIYNSGAPNDISSLNPLHWWRFEEGSGTTATDSGTGGNNGTITGATYQTDVPS